MTASPITLKESRPAPPIDPATTLPVFTPMPTSKPPGRRLLIVRASSTAHCTARSACWGIRSGAPKTASTASPMNWSMWPRWRATIGTMHSKSSLRRPTISGAEASAAAVVKSRTSTKTSETSTSSPPGSKSSEIRCWATCSSR